VQFPSDEFSKHLRKAGTICQLTVHNTPKYNGVAERFNRTAIEKVWALLHESRLPKFLWGEALQHVVYLKNHTWTKSLPDSTPHKSLTGKKPDLSNIHPWGTQVWVHDTSSSKLDSRAKEGRWIGFDQESKCHRIYWPEKRSVTVERSVTFIPEEVDVRIGNAPVEGEMEDFDEILEHADEGNQPIPQPAELKNIEHLISPPPYNPPAVEDDKTDAIEPIQPEIVAEEETGGRGK